MVSVIVPVYNTEKYLDECIRTIVNQSYKNLEIILINDGSTDGSGAICKRWEEADQRIRYIEKENEGQGVTRNLGIAKASGEYILFVDSDDYLDESLIEKAFGHMTEQKADICVFAHYGLDEDEIVDETLLSYKLLEGACVKENRALLSNMMPVLWDKLFSSELMKDTDIQMSNRICEDLVFNARLYVRAQRICMLDVPLYYYRYKRRGNLSTSYERYLEVAQSISELNEAFIQERKFEEYWIQLYDIAVTMFKDILLRVGKRTDLDVPAEIRGRYSEFWRVYKNCLEQWFSEYLDIGLQEKRYALIGSYNLRIVLHRFLLDENLLREDYGYSSIVSLMSDSAVQEISLEEIELSNAYRKRCVEQDIGKTFCKQERLPEADYLIVDLLDEIWNLKRIRDGSYITESPFLQEAGISKLESYERLPFLHESRRGLFKKYMIAFAEKVKAFRGSVIVIRNFLCEKHGKYYDSFTEYANLQEIKEINQELEWYYQYFISCLPGSIVVDSSEFPEFVFTQEDFPFGCEPFYYNKGYYQRMAIEINRRIQDRVKGIERDV